MTLKMNLMEKIVINNIGLVKIKNGYDYGIHDYLETIPEIEKFNLATLLKSW